MLNYKYSKELIILLKLYISDIKKYDNSLTKSLSYKFTIFINLYNRVKISSEILYTIFLSMLKFIILKYYYFSYLVIKLII